VEAFGASTDSCCVDVLKFAALPHYPAHHQQGHQGHPLKPLGEFPAFSFLI
jgi:hypothetical protein